MSASSGLRMLAVSVVDERVQVLSGLNIDMATPAAVPPIRATELDILLPTEDTLPAPPLPERT